MSAAAAARDLPDLALLAMHRPRSERDESAAAAARDRRPGAVEQTRVRKQRPRGEPGEVADTRSGFPLLHCVAGRSRGTRRFRASRHAELGRQPRRGPPQPAGPGGVAEAPWAPRHSAQWPGGVPGHSTRAPRHSSQSEPQRSHSRRPRRQLRGGCDTRATATNPQVRLKPAQGSPQTRLVQREAAGSGTVLEAVLQAGLSSSTSALHAGGQLAERRGSPRCTGPRLEEERRGEVKLAASTDFLFVFFFPPTHSKSRSRARWLGVSFAARDPDRQAHRSKLLSQGSPVSLHTRRTSQHGASRRALVRGREVREGSGGRGPWPERGLATAQSNTPGLTGSTLTMVVPFSQQTVWPSPSARKGKRSSGHLAVTSRSSPRCCRRHARGHFPRGGGAERRTVFGSRGEAQVPRLAAGRRELRGARPPRAGAPRQSWALWNAVFSPGVEGAKGPAALPLTSGAQRPRHTNSAESGTNLRATASSGWRPRGRGHAASEAQDSRTIQARQCSSSRGAGAWSGGASVRDQGGQARAGSNLAARSRGLHRRAPRPEQQVAVPARPEEGPPRG